MTSPVRNASRRIENCRKGGCELFESISRRPTQINRFLAADERRPLNLDPQNILRTVSLRGPFHIGKSWGELVIQFTNLVFSEILQGDLERSIFQAVQHLSGRFREYGVMPVRINFHKGIENKPTVRQSRMRNHQLRVVQDTIPVAQKIKVKRAWPPIDFSYSTELRFDGLQNREKAMRGQSSR